MKRKSLIYGLAILAAVIAWAAFRPERLFVNAKANEGFPTSAASTVSERILASGTFHGVAHDGSGNASIYQLSDGKRVLRFTNFETSNGPDVHVYLVATKDASDSDSVKQAGFVEVGVLKGNIGDQNYELPSDLDLNKYRAVTIWCKRFGVNFATAPLNPASAPISAMNQ
jgi:electron transfer DM13